MYLSENGIQVVATRDDGRFMRKVTIEIDDYVFTRCEGAPHLPRPDKGL